MNKQIRTSLTALIAIIILLAVSIPGLAKKSETAYTCEAYARIINEAGVIRPVLMLLDLNAYWEDGVLYNFCTGTLPWGEDFNSAWRYLTFEEACNHFEALDQATCTNNFLFIEQEDWPGIIHIYDPEKDVFYAATDSLLTVYRSNGKIVWEKWYSGD